MELMAIGTVQSPLRSRAEAPKQGDEGAPEAWLAFEPRFADGLDGLAAGDEVLVLTRLDRAERDVLRVRPRSDAARPMTGVFATRSPDRPNPIGLHRCRVLSVAGARLTVSGLEAVEGSRWWTSRSRWVQSRTADADLNPPRPLWHTREVA